MDILFCNNQQIEGYTEKPEAIFYNRVDNIV